MGVAHAGDDADFWGNQLCKFLNLALLLRTHLGDEHLMLGFQLLVHHPGHAHGGGKAGRCGQHAVLLRQQGFQNLLAGGLSEAAGDADANEIPALRQLRPGGVVEARVDPVLQRPQHQRRNQHRIVRARKQQVGRDGQERQHDAARQIDAEHQQHQSEHAPGDGEGLLHRKAEPQPEQHGSDDRKQPQHQPAAQILPELLFLDHHGQQDGQVPVDHRHRRRDQHVRPQCLIAVAAQQPAQLGNLVALGLQHVHGGNARGRAAERDDQRSQHRVEHDTSLSPPLPPRPASDRSPDAPRGAVPVP